MYFDINDLIEKEISKIEHIYEAVEASHKAIVGEKGADGSEKEYLRERSTSDGIVYDKRVENNGMRDSVRLGGDDDPEVVRIKQRKFDQELLKVLQKNRKLLGKIRGKILPYDPETIDSRLKPLYRDQSGLVNKAPGIISSDEWKRIGNKRNGYPMDADCNVTTDGTKARSKSELIIYTIIKGYKVVFCFDVEITLKNDAGQTVTVCPDFIIKCDDGSIIIIEHLGLLSDPVYLENALKKIHLYLINGFRLNENLFLTADDVDGKINAQAIDNLIRNMILPRVRKH